MGIRGVASIVVSLAFLFYISWFLTVVLVGSMLPMILFSVWYGKKIKTIAKVIQDKVASCTTVAEESFTHIRTIKAFSTEDFETDKYSKGQKEVYDFGVQKCKIEALFALVIQLFIWGIFVLVIILGAYLVEQKIIRIGDITAFMLMAMQLMLKFGLLAATFGAIMSTIGASSKIIKIIEHKPFVTFEGGKAPEWYPEG